MSPSQPLPITPVDLTPERLSALISDLHPGVRVTAADVVRVLGEGEVSTAGRVHLRLSYAPGGQPLPTNVIAKMFVGDMMIGPRFLYETEVGMYGRLLPGLDVVTPACLAAQFEPATGRFILILEDLADRGAMFTDVLAPPLTPQAVGDLLDEQAKLHAHFWESPRLDQEAGWLGTQVSGGQFESFDAIVVPATEAAIAASPYRADLIARIGRTPRELWDATKAVDRRHAASLPMTLCHGDAGAHNSFHLADGASGFLDWQLSVKGGWAHDIQYLIVTSLSVADRRAHEQALVERYLASLRALGVPYDPGIDQAMADYTLATIWGLTVGWGIPPVGVYGMDIISANLERLYAAVCDHHVLDRACALI